MAGMARARGAEAPPGGAAGRWSQGAMGRFRGGLLTILGGLLAIDLLAYRAGDPSLDTSALGPPSNPLGPLGADVADLAFQFIGLAAWLIVLLMTLAGLARLAKWPGETDRRWWLARMAGAVLAIVAIAAALAAPAPPVTWPLATGLGGMAGDTLLALALSPFEPGATPRLVVGGALGLIGAAAAAFCLGAGRQRPAPPARPSQAAAAPSPVKVGRPPDRKSPAGPAETAAEPAARDTPPPPSPSPPAASSAPAASSPNVEIRNLKPKSSASDGEIREDRAPPAQDGPGFHLPGLDLLSKSPPRSASRDEGALRLNAALLETVLSDFGVRGQIDQIRPGPVVTLYELVPAAGVKSARVVALSDDIARSMSLAACRVSVVPGRNAIGIELPNARRETVYLRDLLASPEYENGGQSLPLALGETIDGEPYVADLARMPHLLIAGTTGSGKSVGVNAMILSILHRHPPEKCRFIMIDPKMLELSVYDGIPHLLAPVVTDPKKAIVALKWTVREMEDRYNRMSKIGVRNVAGYNERANDALAKGEHFVRAIATGFDDQGRPIFEEEKVRPEPMPFLVVVIDEVADLMLVAGKDIEGAVQRLAQMARAAGIHLIMATQRPSVDVITGTIKANFPSRISFQVTSKIDSRTIMGEQGAEQLLGMGDMLYMVGGGRIIRLHGPYVDDAEVIKVAGFLRGQGEPKYLEDVTEAPDDEDTGPAGPAKSGGSANSLYDQAVALVTQDGKATTSYIQRRLQIGYNRAASLIERMEKEGVVGPADRVGKRDILAPPPP